MNYNFIVIFFMIFHFSLTADNMEDVSKAMACMGITQKILGLDTGKQPDPRIYSQMMMACFIQISITQSNDVMMNLQTGKDPLDTKTMNKLTDFSKLPSKYSQSEIQSYGERLGRALEKYRKISQGERPDDDDDGEFEETPENTNILKNTKNLIIKSISEIFGIANSFGGIIIILISVFVLVKLIRKTYESLKSNKKEKPKEEKQKEKKQE